MKIINERAYKAYAQLIEGYTKSNLTRGFNHAVNNAFVRGAVAQASLNLDNPFESGSPAAHLFYRMRYCYGLWRNNGIDHQVNYQRMLRAAAEQAALDVENPYTDKMDPQVEFEESMLSLETLAEIELQTAFDEDVESGTFVPVEEVKFFGILPDEEDE